MKKYLIGFSILSLFAAQLSHPTYSATIQRDYYINPKLSPGTPLRTLNENSQKIIDAVSNTVEKDNDKTSNQGRKSPCRKNFIIPINSTSTQKVSSALTPNPKPLPIFRIRCT
jgi:hypothetical protein